MAHFGTSLAGAVMDRGNGAHGEAAGFGSSRAAVLIVRGCGRLARPVSLPAFGQVFARSCFDRDRSGIVLPKCELNPVDRVGPPVRHHLAGVITEQDPAPPQEAAHLEHVLHQEAGVVEPGRCGTAEEVPMESGGHRLLGELGYGERPRVARQVDARHPAEAAGADELQRTVRRSVRRHRPAVGSRDRRVRVRPRISQGARTDVIRVSWLCSHGTGLLRPLPPGVVHAPDVG